ncbi:MAG: hypothetical protein M3P18_15695 [Actinomycetota bacterium]|nr:hypothetical protein [Actinomycetota bacterium]
MDRLPHWLRWLLVLPTAVVAFFAVQFAIIIGGLLSGNELPDWVYQLINSAASGYAFVGAAAWMAPRAKVVTALIHTLLNAVAGFWLLSVALAQSGRQSDAWLVLAGASLLGIVGGGVACYAAWEADRKARVSFLGLQARDNEPRTAADPASGSPYQFVLDYTELSTQLGTTADYTDVTADFGSLLERRGGDVLPVSEEQLPHPKTLIWSALMITIAYHPDQREHAKTAAVSHLQQYLAAEEVAPYAAPLEAARAFLGSLDASPEQAFEAAKSLGDVFERVAPLQRRARKASRQAEATVSRLFPNLWGDGPDYFFWRHSHLTDLLGAGAEAMASLEAMRGTDGPELPSEKEHAQWQIFTERVRELTDLVKEADHPLANMSTENTDVHDAYLSLIRGLYFAVVQVGAPADEQARAEASANYGTFSETLGKVNKQEAEAMTAALRQARGLSG